MEYDTAASDMEYDEVLSDTDFSQDEQSEEEEALQLFSTEIKHFNVLCLDDIRRRQESAIQQVSSLCSLSPSNAAILLRHFMWCVSSLTDQWFADEHKVRSATGLLDNFPITKSSKYHRRLFCEICREFFSFSRNNMKALACGHYFCCECWKQYIRASIDNYGPGSLNMRCPHPQCDVAVGEDMAVSLITDKKNRRYFLRSNVEEKKEYRAKFEGFLLRSYVEQNRSTKWCPAPGCEYAIEFVGGRDCYDVVCKCSHTFCWNCLEEVHRPVDCETVRKWTLKNRDSAASDKWIRVNSKPCPKCNRHIEKNQGCMHMTCARPCRYQFCWLCLGDWLEHGSRIGGNYTCNRYENAVQEGLHEEEEQEREVLRQSLKRDAYYYERWVANESAKAKAVSDLQQIKDVKIHTLSNEHCQTLNQLKFVIDAWLQIIECRRVLKWTYAYGYFLSDDLKKNVFEYLQGFAERALEQLHECAETELRKFVEGESSSSDFLSFRIKLENRTNTTRTFFENLVKSLENGLYDEKVETIL